MRRFVPILPIAVCWAALAVCAGVPENADPGGSIAQEIERLFVDLDSDDFAVRTRAFQRLEQLSVGQPSRQVLAESVERATVNAEISFEVRKQLERLRRDLPPVQSPPSQNIDADAIDRLLEQLGDDSYARRLGAESRLRWLLGSADGAGLVYDRVKRTAATQPAPEQARSLKRVYESARAAWLEDDARQSDPAASAEQIATLVDRLAAPDAGDRFRLTGEPAALAELRDLVACDANVAPIRNVLQTRLGADSLSPDGRRHLNGLLDLTRPAMVAEYWNAGRHRNIQRLLVGVPSETEGLGTSHFDRIDDQTAHCVAGVNLAPGDYPVGVAIPHPSRDPRERAAFFHLINLPTPCRRMAYEYRATEDESARYAAIVERTLDRYLALQQPIDERAMVMIMQFDPSDVSRFAGRYLSTVDDRRIAIQPGQVVEAQFETPIEEKGPSIHTQFCTWLAFRGTRDAMPGLLAAVDQNRMSIPNDGTSYRYDRCAALAIAQRDPWPEVDRWLEKMLPRSETLIAGQAEGPEFGATAAAMLLRRHGASPEDFDLTPIGDAIAQRCGLETYRYQAADAPKKVADWWSKRQAEAGSSGTTAESRVEVKE